MKGESPTLNTRGIDCLGPAPSDRSSITKKRLHNPTSRRRPQVTILTGGADKPYALGLVEALSGVEVVSDFIGSDYVSSPSLLTDPNVNFWNFRDQRANANRVQKIVRIFIFYIRLLWYAVTSQAKVFHILWNNKIEWFDRTFLTLFYSLLAKKIVLTAHNVNGAERDSRDSLWNRITLRIQYRAAHHIFVHTERMKDALTASFGVNPARITVIPFGINNTLPQTLLSKSDARQHFGLRPKEKVILFFGNIAPYKGLEFLVQAFSRLARGANASYRLVIAGRLKCTSEYWECIRKAIGALADPEAVIQRIEFIPDDKVECYFKAADVLVLPYTYIFQSGVLFLGYSFGLPVLAADVGSLKEEIVEGKTGFTFRPQDPDDLARALEEYFASPLFGELESHRQVIQDYASDRYSWSKVARVTSSVYRQLITESTS